jgi:hypothetical protein
MGTVTKGLGLRALVPLHGELAASLGLVAVFAWLGERSAFAQEVTPDAAAPASPDAESDPEPGFELPALALHGFVSQGAFLSTDNDYLGRSERGSVEFLEAALNVSTEVTDRLRVGAQLFTRDLGPIGNYSLTLDWAYLDYRWRDWLGLRAGRVKMPFGLYNEFSDIDSARLPILLPQSVYPIVNRDFLLAHTGFSLYGSHTLGGAGALDYQLFAGTIFILEEGGALNASAQLNIGEIDTKYVTGGQLFWRTPVPGLRAGASYLHTDIVFHLSFDPVTTALLRMRGVVPDDFDGTFEYGLSGIDLIIGSIEYTLEDLTLAAEYSRWTDRVTSSIPDVLRESDQDDARFYGMAAYRVTGWFEAGTYYSVLLDVDDLDLNGAALTEGHRGYRKDLAVSTRFDVNDFWLWKLEAHYMKGTADVPDPDPEDPDDLARRWGLFLVKTTVSF